MISKTSDEVIEHLVDLSSNKLMESYKMQVKTIVDDLHKMLDLLPQHQLNKYLEIPLAYIKNFQEQIELPDVKSNPDILNITIKNSLDTITNYMKSLSEMILAVNFAKPKESLLQCTLTQTGNTYTNQKIYRCKTCSLEVGKVICENCIKSCHKDHNVYSAGMGQGFCDCAYTSPDRCQLQTKCSFIYTGSKYFAQTRYVCNTCNLTNSKGAAICGYCIDKCHQGHNFENLGVSSCYCDCPTMGKKCASLSQKK